MADLKITGLTENTTPVSTDLVAIVDDPGSVPLTQKTTLSNLSKGIDHGNLTGLSTGADHSYIDQDVTSGSSPTFDGTNFTGIAAISGSIIQTISSTYSTQTNISSSTLTDSGLSATITPTSSSNKILVMFNMGEMKTGAVSNGFTVKLLRGASVIYTPGTYFAYQAANARFQVSGTYLDSPATTSATTYKIQGARPLGAGTNVFQEAGATSTMTLFEIKG